MKWGVPYATRNVVREYEEKLVRETWDTSTERPLTRAFIRRRLGGLTRRNMERTLERIEAAVTS